MSKKKTCKECGEQISKKAKSCPKCGVKQGLPTWIKAVIIFLIIIGLVCACTSSCTNSVNEAIEETENSYKDINGKEKFLVNETFENKYFKVTITDVDENWTGYDEYFEPTEGTKVVRVAITAENVGTESSDISSLYFNCYADGVVVDEYIWGSSEDATSFGGTISAGKKTTGYLYYEVPKDSEEIVLEYEPNVLDDKLVIKFEI